MDRDENNIETINPYKNSYLRNQMDQNMILRVSIRKDYLKKREAAVKIQKVWRGYMTRKILAKYIMEEEERIINSSNLNSNFHRYNLDDH